MERNGIDKLKKACIILPLVVAVIFNSSVAAIDRENNSKLSCGIDSYCVKDMVAQDNHIWLLLHDNSIDKDAVACINEKTLELQACYRSGEDSFTSYLDDVLSVHLRLYSARNLQRRRCGCPCIHRYYRSSRYDICYLIRHLRYPDVVHLN